MKKITIIAFLLAISFVAIPSTAQIYNPYYPGSTFNPIQIQIVPDPSQEYLQNLRYQMSDYNREMDKIIRDSELETQRQAQQDYQTQMLQQQKMQTRLLQQQLNRTFCNGTYWDSCPPGQDFVCPSSGKAYCKTSRTKDQICQGNYGLNSVWTGSTNSNGGPICGCQDGFQFNQEKTACVSQTQVISATNSQFCQNHYGSFSLWLGGGVDAQNNPICSCQSGFVWNEQKTNCIVPTIAPVKAEINAPAPLINNVSEIQIRQDEMAKETIPQNKIELSVSTSSNRHVATGTEAIKQRGFWLKLKGWLGF